MELTNAQEKGRKIAVEKFKNHESYVVISGYAGTGKSVLISYIVASLGLKPDIDVCYACPTGKACNQLQKLGHRNVTTLHRLLWKYEVVNGGFVRRSRAIGDIPYRLIVVDEVSMVSQPTIAELLKHRIFVVFCGDPFQLPPVSEEAPNRLLETPDIFLDEVMRQAKESDIIRLSMDIREKRQIGLYKGNDLMILPNKELYEGHLRWADQILVATNNTRNAVNQKMRALNNSFGDLPQLGDKIIARKNYHETFGGQGYSLVNGTIGYLSNRITPNVFYLPKDIRCIESPIRSFNSHFITDYGEDYGYLDIDMKGLKDGRYSLEEIRAQSVVAGYCKRRFKNNEKMLRRAVPYYFEYGYAITTHMAQGSSWGKVLLIEEKFPFNRLEHSRWLYTGCTRPTEKLVIIKGDF